MHLRLNIFKYSILFGFLIFSACKGDQTIVNPPSTDHFIFPDSLSARRIAFVLQIRQQVASKFWEGFADKRTEGPFIYFNGNNSEIFFPDSQVLSKIESYEKFSSDYIITGRTDTIPYHFELMISFDEDDSSKIYFEHPVQQFLSVEETSTYIPSVTTTEMWTTMVIHEMFHHFQFNNPTYFAYAKSEIGNLPFDIRHLKQLCEDDDNFLSLVQIENDLLLSAISENDSVKRKAIIEDYLSARENRVNQYSPAYPLLEKVEAFYCLQEGSARYAEYQSMKILNEMATQTDSLWIKDDPRFKNQYEFNDIALTSEAFNYLISAGPNTYPYAIGFNQMRLLDQLGVDYKGELLDKPKKPFHVYLEESIHAL